MYAANTVLDKLKKFEFLFQQGYRSSLADNTLNKLAEIELFGLRKDIREVNAKIDRLEKHYNMTTENFLKKFNSGEIGDDADFIEWFAYADMQSALREKIEIFDESEC